MFNVLVCDDDKEIVEAIEIYLRQEGYNVLKAYDGQEAIKVLDSTEVDLLIIDVMMPKLDGIRATLKIREKNSLPIIILSAKSEDADKILGLNVGADDYLTKPFNPLELVARVKSQLRRYFSLGSAAKNQEEVIVNGGLVLNKHTKSLQVDGEDVHLTATEYKIVELLMSNMGYVFSAEEIYDKVWQERAYGIENTVMVHIRHLREKMSGPTGKSDFIKTVWGVGYKVEE